MPQTVDVGMMNITDREKNV